MSGSPAFQQLTVQTLEEHRQVHFYLDQLMRTLEEADAGAPEATARLSAELGSLIERLTEHFAGEEQGGLYHGVLDLLPNQTGEVRRLSDQHARLLDRLEMARLHAQRGGAAELPALCQDLRTFVDVLRAHEEAEDELLRQALEVESRA
jgi:hemerythrin-like domain-containing protein